MTNPDKETTERMSDTVVSVYQSVKHAFTDHPREVRMNYCSHFLQSARMSCYMAKGAITLAIHAVFPFLLKNTYVVQKLHDEQKESKEEEPQETDKSN
jgi:hypothetical protein